MRRKQQTSGLEIRARDNTELNKKEKESMDVISASVGAGSQGIEKVVLHPLVLLSIVDNYNRVAKDTRRRVLGVLLGSTFRGRVDITNSYAGFVLAICSSN